MPAERTGAELIAAERQRQIDAEGHTPDHDDLHADGALAWAAACYAAPATVYAMENGPANRFAFREPWPIEWTGNFNRGEPGYRPWRRPECDRITELVKAGALIAAEIDRIQRT